jgi:hypothetical protein
MLVITCVIRLIDSFTITQGTCKVDVCDVTYHQVSTFSLLDIAMATKKESDIDMTRQKVITSRQFFDWNFNLCSKSSPLFSGLRRLSDNTT